MNDFRHFSEEPTSQQQAEWSHQLQGLRWKGWQGEPPELKPRRTYSLKRRVLAAAVLLLSASGLWFGWKETAPTSAPSGYAAIALAGEPRTYSVDGGHQTSLQVGVTQALAIGQRLSTPAGSRLRLQVGTIGEVVLEEQSSVSIADADSVDGAYYLELEKGRMVASIFAAPRVFQVGTPAGIAVDLGCIYETEILDQERTQLSVISGRVSFESHGRAVVVPSGAMVWALPGVGPSAPIRRQAKQAFRQAWEAAVVAAEDSVEQQQAVAAMVDAAEVADAMTLWYLLRDESTAYRPELIAALHQLAPAPPELDVTAGSELDDAALNQWRQAYRW
jgi:hypothetical protein